MPLKHALIGPALAFCLVVPAFAQEAPQPVVKAVSVMNDHFVQNWNKHDPAALAALFTPDAIFVSPTGSSVGSPGVQQYYEKLFAAVHPSADFTHDIDRVEILSGDLTMGVGHWNLSRPALKGFWSAVYQHQGEAWAMRAHIYNIMPPAPAAESANTSSR